MERQSIINALKPFFKVSELVCPHTYKKWGEQSWQFLDTNLLWCILIIRRDIVRKPMVVNNGSSYTQRGLRCNRCDLVRTKSGVYLSAHIFGKAIDFTVPGMTAEQVRKLIKDNAGIFPCNIRLEKGVSWVHIDVLPQYGVTAKVYEFNG